jgi:hypothetical protein
MGIDTLDMMMQYDLRLNYEMYESVTILLYHHCTSTFSHIVLLSFSSIAIPPVGSIFDLQKAMSEDDLPQTCSTGPPTGELVVDNDLVHHTTTSPPILSFLTHVVNSLFHSLT